MPADWNARIIAALDRLPGEAPWDVFPGQHSPRPEVCGEYASATDANAAVVAAGFAPTGDFVPAPSMGAYDLRSVLRYAKEGVYLLVAKRAEVVTEQ